MALASRYPLQGVEESKDADKRSRNKVDADNHASIGNSGAGYGSQAGGGAFEEEDASYVKGAEQVSKVENEVWWGRGSLYRSLWAKTRKSHVRVNRQPGR